MGDPGTFHGFGGLLASATLLEIRAGKIKSFGTAKSAIDKRKCVGPTSITKFGVEGDQQSYFGHGGIDKALHWYCTDHYEDWRKKRPSSAHLFKPGGFGENLVVRGLNESNVCIGGKYGIGDQVIVEVSEPRQPCYQLNQRFDWDDASHEVQKSGRTGWYLRVLQEGNVQAGDIICLLERPNSQWSIENVSRILYIDIKNIAALKELSSLPHMGLEIRNLCARRLRNNYEDQAGRLSGNDVAIEKVWWTSKLVHKKLLTPKVISLRFETDIDQDSPILALGSFAHMRLRFGPDQKYTRAYSVVRGNFREFELGVSREDNSTGGSTFLHGGLNVGDIVEVARSPKHQGLTADNLRHLFIIGGVGVTAFVQHIEKLRRASAAYEIHYAVRGGPEDVPYLSLLDSSKTTFYYSSRRLRLDVQKVIDPDAGQNQQTIIYCCGPQSLNAAVQKRCDEVKWSPSLTHFEDFGAGGSRAPFEVEIHTESYKRRMYVSEDVSLLQALRQAGLDIPSSCESGSCGMCKVAYHAGKVIHRGVALSEDEKNSSMLSCVSRAEGRLELEL